MSAASGEPLHQPSPEALQAYELYLDRVEDRTEEGSSSFEGFCGENPELEPELRRIHADWGFVESLLGRFGDVPSVSSVRGDRRGDLVEGTQPEGPIGLASGTVGGVLERIEAQSASPSKFRRFEVLGKGGMGVVRRVWDEGLHRYLAMKIMGRERSGNGSSSHTLRLARFLEEARVTAQLDHPGIAPVHEIGIDAEGNVFFTMKLVDGQTLQELIEKLHAGSAEFRMTRAINVLLKVCQAMAYAHEKGVIHRDLKPSNVMVGRFGEVYVMDWGLARLVDERDLRDLRIPEPGAGAGPMSDTAALVTMDGDVIGTPAYMSPEQARGDLERMGEPSDVYAVGALLYHLLAGEAPYADRGAQGGYAILDEVRKGPPSSIERVAPQAPPELLAICEKAMEREPARRYASMPELAKDLTAYLDGRVVSAYRTGTFIELKKWIARNRGLATAVGAGVLALAGLVSTSLIYIQMSQAEALLTRLEARGKLDELHRRARDLWPPHPDLIDEYSRWLDEADSLRRQLRGTGSFAGFALDLRDLRQRARPPSPEESEHQRLSHPSYWLYQDTENKITSLLRADRVRLGLERVQPDLLDACFLEKESRLLAAEAFPLVHLNRYEWGREIEGWLIALVAVENAQSDEELAEALSIEAWGLLALGLDAEALRCNERARELARDRDEALLRYEQQCNQIERSLARDHHKRIEGLEARRSLLNDELRAFREYRFDDPTDQAVHDQMERLVEDVEALLDEETGLVRGLSPEHGWGIERRLAFAESVRAASIDSPEAKARWSRAIEEIHRSPHYDGLMIEPQVGLLPLGADPDSGLFEFAHLQSGRAPTRNAKGELFLSSETSIVLVLVPGGTFVRGVQKGDPRGPNYDAEATGSEGPPFAVRLDPFLLSKYEMTQAQWLRIAGDNPSRYLPGYRSGSHWVTPLHPVEEVSWEDCEQVLSWMGLDFPTEAQWEYAARANTQSPWWSGEMRDDLARAANLLDESVRQKGKVRSLRFESWADGYDLHAPVGRFEANAFGFHDVLGNVKEWCFDGYQEGYRRWGPESRNPIVDSEESRWRTQLYRMTRGGGYESTAELARTARRDRDSPDYRSSDLGIRPARRLQ